MESSPDILDSRSRYVPPGPLPGRPKRRPERLWLHVLLFALTFLSALYAQMPVFSTDTIWDILAAPLLDPARLWVSLPFAATLMTILLAHEMGHYMTAQRYGVDQSMPYFIPAPTFFGTLGAVIFMRSQPPNRRALLNVAVMGPYAGLVIAVPASAWGLAHSTAVDLSGMSAGMEFGDSVLFAMLEHFFSPNGSDVILHPVAMAGWVGLFITSLNLIPAAQLDGGHVAYALFGAKQEKISLAVVIGLLFFGLHSAFLGAQSGSQGGAMWILWAFLLFFIGIRHPPVQDENLPLSSADRLNGALALLVFVLTFIPVPLRTLEPQTFDEAPQGETHPNEGAVPPNVRKQPPSNHEGPAEEFRL